MTDYSFLEGSAAAYSPVNANEEIPGRIVEVRDVSPGDDEEDIRVVLETEAGEVDTSRDRVEVL